MSGSRLLAALALILALGAQADERISVCFNYGCLTQAEVVYSEAQLAEIARLLGTARDAVEEREQLGVAVGRLLGWAGEQSPIVADRGGNYADAAVYGRMDCIDHSTTTTRLLHLLERRALLRFHRVLAPALRQSFLIFEHYSALVEEVEEVDPATPVHQADASRYVIDSWFFDNGHAAAVMPLAQWQSGEYPDGAE